MYAKMVYSDWNCTSFSRKCARDTPRILTTVCIQVTHID